jgi:hypothetical protein
MLQRIYQIWDAGNDRNGNPRRLTMVFAVDANNCYTVAARDHNYTGDQIPTSAATLPTVLVAPAVYREGMRSQKWRDIAAEYLAAGLAIPDPGEPVAAFMRSIRGLGHRVRGDEIQRIKGAVWSLEALTDADRIRAMDDNIGHAHR